MADGRSWVISGSVSVAKVSSRFRVRRDSSRKVGRDLEDLSQVLVAPRGRREDRVGVLDQAPELALALGEGVEDDAGVVDELLDAPRSWVSRTRSRRLASSAKGSRLPIARRDVGAAAVERDRRLLHPGLEGGAGGLVEGAEDLVELHRVGDLGRRQRAVLGQLSGRRVALGQLDVGLAEQRLLTAGSPGCPRGSARSRRRSRSSRPRGRCSRPSSPSSISFTLPTETLEIRTSDSTASWVASLNGTLTR